MPRTPSQPPFEGNLIRARDYMPCGCAEKPHWWLVEEDGTLVNKACPGRRAVTPFESEEGEVLGYRI